jgi:hypothetical protein
MRRLIVVLIISILTGLLSACGEKAETHAGLSLDFYTPLLVNNYESLVYPLEIPVGMPRVYSAEVVKSNNGAATAELTVENGQQIIKVSVDRGKTQPIDGKYATYLYQPKIKIAFLESDLDKSNSKEQIAKYFDNVKNNAVVGYINHYAGGSNTEIVPIQYDFNNQGFSLKTESALKIADQYTGFINTSRDKLLHDSNLQLTVNQIVGKLSSPMEKTTAIYNYVNQHVKYDKVYQDKVGKELINPETTKGVLKTLKSGMGICQDQAYTMHVMLELAGIPSRLALGNFRGEQGVITHIWSEVNINGKWIIADTAGGRLGDTGPNKGQYVTVLYAEQAS